jgi:hypothetical protein
MWDMSEGYVYNNNPCPEDSVNKSFQDIVSSFSVAELYNVQ